jgi:hypothetical protein
MSGLGERVKGFFRNLLFGAAILYLVLMVMHNWGERARFWYWFGSAQEELPVTRLMAGALLIGIVLGMTGLATLTALMQYRRNRRDRIARKREQEVAAMNRKASMLRTKPLVTRVPPSVTATSEGDSGVQLDSSGSRSVDSSGSKASTEASPDISRSGA